MILADGKTKANPDVMRKAAKVLGVEIPKARGAKQDQELLGNLRFELEKRLATIDVSEHVQCVVCGEVATETPEYCPFCGDEGNPEEEGLAAEVVPSAPPAAATGVGISKTPVPTTQNVELATAELEKDLAARLMRITELKHSVVGMSYDIGLECKEIRDRQLYKARGFTSFKAFAEQELPFARESALQLISIVEKHTREDYNQIGYAKLRVISAVQDGAVKTELMDAARKGATTKSLIERSKSLAPGSGGTKKAAPAEQGERITLLGRVGARNQVIRFHDTTTGEVVDNAGVFKSHNANVYGELEVADGVFIRVGLRVNEQKQLEALTVRFVRAADAAE